MSKVNTNTTAEATDVVEATPTAAEVEEIVFPNLQMIVCGKATTLLSTQYKARAGQAFDNSKRYWCFREPTRKDGSFGVNVTPKATDLPTFVVIDGVKVSLEKGLTAASWTDRATSERITVTEEERRPLVAFNGLQTLPTIGKVCNVIVTISVTQHGQWNIKVIVSIPESPEEKAARLQAEAKARAAANDALFA